MSLELKIKHAGKTYDVTVDMGAPGAAFKQQIFELTGVDPSKVKVVVKGGMLKVRFELSLQTWREVLGYAGRRKAVE